MMNQLKYEATIVNGYANTCMYADIDYYEDWLTARTFAQTFLDITEGKEIDELTEKEITNIKYGAEHLVNVAFVHAHPEEPYIGEWFSTHEFSENILNAFNGL